MSSRGYTLHAWLKRIGSPEMDHRGQASELVLMFPSLAIPQEPRIINTSLRSETFRWW
jgi:hypothetical protein